MEVGTRKHTINTNFLSAEKSGSGRERIKMAGRWYPTPLPPWFSSLPLSRVALCRNSMEDFQEWGELEWEDSWAFVSPVNPGSLCAWEWGYRGLEKERWLEGKKQNTNAKMYVTLWWSEGLICRHTLKDVLKSTESVCKAPSQRSSPALGSVLEHWLTRDLAIEMDYNCITLEFRKVLVDFKPLS